MRAFRKFVGLALSPWLRTIRTAFDLFGNPRQLTKIISSDDETSVLRSLGFLTTAYAIALTIIAGTLFAAKHYQGHFGIEHDVKWSDLAASVNALAVFIIFGFVNLVVFRAFGERQMTLQTVWHHYSYVVGSGVIVLITLLVGLTATYWTTVWVMIRVIEVGSLEAYKLVDLTYAFSFVLVMLFVLFYYVGMYAASLNRLMGISKVKVFLCVLVSYVSSIVLLILAVLAFDRITGIGHYETSGLIGYERMIDRIRNAQ